VVVGSAAFEHGMKACRVTVTLCCVVLIGAWPSKLCCRVKVLVGSLMFNLDCGTDRLWVSSD
jgi:hypothetical protein